MSGNAVTANVLPCGWNLRLAVPNDSGTSPSIHRLALIALWLIVSTPVAAGASEEPGETLASTVNAHSAPSDEATPVGIAGAPTAKSPRGGVSGIKHLGPIIDGTAKRYGVEPTLVHAVIAAESAFDPTAVSRAGAIGLMQVMPETAADYDVSDPSALFDPKTNVETGVRHLKRLIAKYGNDYGRVIMAYNAGENVVDRTDGGVTYLETLNYTEAVIRHYRKRGGKQRMDEAMNRVARLRGKTRAARSRGSPTGEDRSLILPKASPKLENRLLEIRQGSTSSKAGPSTRVEIANRRRYGVGGAPIRPAVDPAIRSAGQGRSLR